MRRILFTTAGIALLISGCSSEAGPTPGRQAQDPGPAALATKLDALSTDPCFSAPQAQSPAGCEKYITQLGSTTGTIRKHAGTAYPEMAEQANNLEKGITDFRANNCPTVTTPETQPCSDTLTNIAAILDVVEAELSKQLTPG